MTNTRTQAAEAPQGHEEPSYLTVIVVLAVLTVVEIAVVFAPLPKLSIGIMLVGLALTKAIIVALYFMHLKFEKTTLALIAATPLVLCTLLMLALLPDNNPDHFVPPVAQAPVATEAPATP
jgi:cytochrome c oxidase subunit 4